MTAGSRIATLNIRHGGGRQIDALCARILGYDADVLVVTEFRENVAGEKLLARLREAGYATSYAEAAPSKNRVLLASRQTIDQAWALDDALDPCRLWCAMTAGASICGALFPQKSEKQPYWSALIDRARREGVDLIIGDFNTGNNSTDKDPNGAAFYCADMPERLIDAGYVDLWRTAHPHVREYSWLSNSGNGFRIDHAFATPALSERVITCEFDHAPRLSGETDHSAIVISLDQ